jgi:hypothetical protein
METKKKEGGIEEMNTKIIAINLIIALVLGVGMASALSKSGGGDWKCYHEDISPQRGVRR